MRWKVTLVAEVESGQSIEHDIASVDRDDRITPATLGLSIAEGGGLGGDSGAVGWGPGETPRRGRPTLPVVWTVAVVQGSLPVDLSVGLRQYPDAGAAISRVPVPD
jgi:hypothetical protein